MTKVTLDLSNSKSVEADLRRFQQMLRFAKSIPNQERKVLRRITNSYARQWVNELVRELGREYRKQYRVTKRQLARKNKKGLAYQSKLKEKVGSTRLRNAAPTITAIDMLPKPSAYSRQLKRSSDYDIITLDNGSLALEWAVNTATSGDDYYGMGEEVQQIPVALNENKEERIQDKHLRRIHRYVERENRRINQRFLAPLLRGRKK